MDDGFSCFRHYPLSKFHALLSLRLARLRTYVAGRYRCPVGEGYHRFLPFVDWWFEMEDIEPNAGQAALAKQFQEAGTIDNVPSRCVDQVGPSPHHRKPLTVQQMVSLRSIRNMDRHYLGLLQKLLDRLGELIAKSGNTARLDDIIAKDICLETYRKNP